MEKAKAVLAALAIFVIGTSILVAGILIANREESSPQPAAATAKPAMAMGGANMAVVAKPSTRAAATTKLQIVHIARGCHTFAAGDVQAPAMTLQMRHGQSLDLTNLDVDMQKMMQVAGPQMMSMMKGVTMDTGGGHMAMTFSQAGTYRFKFTQPPMPGAADEGDDSSNPDNTLSLVVQAI
jgi:hypothetical protein